MARTEDRVPPQDLEAERSVLGGILFSPDAFDEVASVVEVHHFYADAHRKVFAAMKDMYDRGIRAIDIITLAHELGRRNDLENVGGPAYLSQIMAAVPHAAHAVYYARIVHGMYLRRSVIETATEAIRAAFDNSEDPDSIVAKAGEALYRVAENRTSNEQPDIGTVLDRTFEKIFERMEQTGDVTGRPSGFADLDEKTSGFQPTELIVLAARPAMGKTALVCNITMSVVKSGSPVLLFSLEQSSTELAERLLCIEAKISGHALRKGTLGEAEQQTLYKAGESLRGFPIYVDDTPGRTITQICAICRRLSRKAGLGMVIIDYLQLIESDEKAAQREQQISTIARRLKFLAKELQIPVMALAQLNRGVENREEKRPRLSDIRESGSVEQDADIVMFLHRPEVYNPTDRPGEAEIIVQKNRHGPTGIVDVVWIKDQMRFANKASAQTSMDF